MESSIILVLLFVLMVIGLFVILERQTRSARRAEDVKFVGNTGTIHLNGGVYVVREDLPFVDLNNDGVPDLTYSIDVLSSKSREETVIVNRSQNPILLVGNVVFYNTTLYPSTSTRFLGNMQL